MNSTTYYKIITADSTYSLAIEINKMIADGWIPTGGVSVTDRSRYSNEYTQAVWVPPRVPEADRKIDNVINQSDNVNNQIDNVTNGPVYQP